MKDGIAVFTISSKKYPNAEKRHPKECLVAMGMKSLGYSNVSVGTIFGTFDEKIWRELFSISSGVKRLIQEFDDDMSEISPTTLILDTKQKTLRLLDEEE